MTYIGESLADLIDETPVRRFAARTASKVGEDLQRRTRRNTPVSRPMPGVSRDAFIAGRDGRLPGTLRNSWELDTSALSAAKNVYGVTVLTRDPIAPFVEWPTRPHVIRPRKDRAPATVVATRRPRRMGTDPMARLRFVTADGRVVYAAEVNHPGTQGKYMLTTALAEVAASWERIAHREWREEVRLMWRGGAPDVRG